MMILIMNNKRKLLDTFKNIDPSLSQLDSLKELLFIHSIPYKEERTVYQPTTNFYDIYGKKQIAPIGPLIDDCTLHISNSSFIFEFIFKNKRLAYFNTNETYDDFSVNPIEDDSISAIHDWLQNNVKFMIGFKIT